MDLALRCRCGVVTGVARELRPSNTSRVVCYCNDCQAFAKAIGRDDVVNAHGGTDILQMHPVNLQFATGTDELRCLRLSEKGLNRWYTACCSTPLGNTGGPGLPFIGVIVRAWTDIDDASLDAALGTSDGIMGRFAKDPQTLTTPLHPRIAAGTALKIMRMALGGLLRRGHKPSPVFNDDGTPKATPRVLSTTGRDALR